MTAAQLQAMQAGAARARVAHLEEQVAKVDAYNRWSREGGSLAEIPEVPRDADYKAVRRFREATT